MNPVRFPTPPAPATPAPATPAPATLAPDTLDLLAAALAGLAGPGAGLARWLDRMEVGQ
jgi:hypothetical protein